MTRKKRYFYCFLLLFLPFGAKRRTEFIRKHNLYGSVGKNCSIMRRKIPHLSNLIFLHDNVRLGSDVGFAMHDGIHNMLNNRPEGGNFQEKVGCVEIMNNVFIGARTLILYNTRIGNNVIIGANSLVNKDIPDNSVYAGIPAHFICSFDEYVKKHQDYSEKYRTRYGSYMRNDIDSELAGLLYKDFIEDRVRCCLPGSKEDDKKQNEH